MYCPSLYHISFRMKTEVIYINIQCCVVVVVWMDSNLDMLTMASNHIDWLLPGALLLTRINLNPGMDQQLPPL